jgi:hypothetical protein
MAVFMELDFEGFTTDQYDAVNDALDPQTETLGDDAPEIPDPKFTELHNAYSV